MKQAVLLHNPTSGDESHDKDDLCTMIEEEGFNCRYSSTKKKGIKKIGGNTEFLVIAGGDGTVKKVIHELLENDSEHLPIAILPCGTANNIARTLGIEGEIPDIVKGWHDKKLKQYDIGITEGIKDVKFFLEGLGIGVFPKLIKEMKNIKENPEDTPDDRLRIALETLHEIILSYKPVECTIDCDGDDYSGKYLLVEIMNITSIGPNLDLAHHADPGDGFFDVVLVQADQRKELAEYVNEKIKGVEPIYHFKTVRAKKIKIQWSGKHLHADDQLLKLEDPAKVTIRVDPDTLKFLIP